MHDDTIPEKHDDSSNIIVGEFPSFPRPKSYADPFLANNKWRSISQLRVGSTPTSIILLEGALERESLHRQYDEPELPRFFRCADAPCPWCTYVARATAHLLVPVFSMEIGEVQVLFDPEPGTVKQSVISLLKKFVAKNGAGHRVISVRQAVGYEYEATSTLIPLDSDIGFDIAEAFNEARKAKTVKLASAFWKPTQAELLDVPLVLRKKASADALEAAVEPFPIGAGEI